MKRLIYTTALVIAFLASTLLSAHHNAVGLSFTYLQGRLTILWGDGVAGDGQSTRYFLERGSEDVTELIFEPFAETTHLLLYNNQTVIVQGIWDSQPEEVFLPRFRVARIVQDQDVTIGSDAISGPQPWVSVLCKFADIDDEPRNLTFFQGMYANIYPGLDHYWREQSYGIATLEGSNAVGWYTLPFPRDHYISPGGSLNFSTITADCTALADVDLYYPSYVGINLMFNAELDGYAWGGTWHLCLDGLCQNWRMTWEPPWGYTNIGVIAHETGHGFGLPHSSGDYGLTYDNAWDVMSDVWSNGERGAVHPVYGVMGQHTISYHKYFLGWIDEAHMVSVPTGSWQTVTIERLSLPQTSDPLGVKVQINDSKDVFYTLEARQFAGYDGWLPGQAIVIHHVDVNRSDSQPAHVVDSDGNGDTGDAGAMWLPGETFVDLASGIAVKVDAATDTGFIVTVANKVPISEVAIAGPLEGAIGQEITFSAQVLPVYSAEPISYLWEATDQLPITHTGSLTDEVTLTWLAEGTKTITVTASNQASVISDTFAIDIKSVAPDSVVIQGPATGVVETTYSYTATVDPLLTATPITYVWQASGQDLITHTSGLTDTVSYAWQAIGDQSINLRAYNSAGEVVAAFTTSIINPVFAVDISGITTGNTGVEYTFTGQVSPATTILPLTYVWTVGDLLPVTHTSELTDALTLNWDSPGVYDILLQVTNAYYSASFSHQVTITDLIFIPLVQK